MKNGNIDKQAVENKLDSEWEKAIKENAEKITNQNNFETKSIFALYFTKVKNINVPYLVFIPKKLI